MEKSRIKIVLAYDGTDYVGWQVQNNGRSIQSALEKAAEILSGEKTKIIGAGRTDSGVHARGQAAHFDTTLVSLPPEKYCFALNARLPKDIRVLSSTLVNPSFHARFDALERVYRYYLLPGLPVSPFEYRYCLPVKRALDLKRLRELSLPLSGTHDFTVFSAAGDKNKSKVRNISRAIFYPQGRYLVFEIAGSSFLWKMVRSLVGTMLELEEKGAGPKDMEELLNSRDRSLAGVTAPAWGLFLEKVVYPGD